MELSSIILLMGGLGLIVLGYLIGFKYKYQLIGGYQVSDDSERYPTEIEQKYCRNIGMPAIITGIICVLTPFMAKHAWFKMCFLVFLVLTIAYTLIVPKQVAKKELNKLNGNGN